VTDQLRAWGPAAAWAGLLFWLSSLPGTSLSWVSVSDLAAHFGVYMVLGAALAYGRHAAGWGVAHWVIVLVGVLYGASDEWHQSFVADRSPAVADWIADTLGVTAGYALTLAVLRRWARAATQRGTTHT
jgi:VanZ family protein